MAVAAQLYRTRANATQRNATHERTGGLSSTLHCSVHCTLYARDAINGGRAGGAAINARRSPLHSAPAPARAPVQCSACLLTCASENLLRCGANCQPTYRTDRTALRRVCAVPRGPERASGVRDGQSRVRYACPMSSSTARRVVDSCSYSTVYIYSIRRTARCCLVEACNANSMFAGVDHSFRELPGAVCSVARENESTDL